MRQKAIVPVIVPPIKPAGVLDDQPTSRHARFEHTIEPIKEGARVRIWGGCEAEPFWLPVESVNTGVLGTVVRFLVSQGTLSQEAVVRLDRPLVVEGVIGEFVVLNLCEAFGRWTSGEGVSIELCDFEPNTRFFRKRERGVVVERSAFCELL